MKLKLTARCIVLKNGKLLVQVGRRGDFYKLPGGKVKPEETIVKTLEREMYEELGLKLVKPPSLVAIVDSFYRDRGAVVHEVGFYFVCEVDGSPRPREDHIVVKWVDLESGDVSKLKPSVLLELVDAIARGSCKLKPMYLVSVEL